VSSPASAPGPGLNEHRPSVPPFSNADELTSEPVITGVTPEGSDIIIFFEDEQPQIKKIINKKERFLST
jgi:hypothetical protein